LVRNARRWYMTRRIEEPAAIKAATTAYYHDSDSVGQWIDDCCERPDGSVHSRDLSRSYQSWWQDNGHTPLKGKSLGDALERHGLKPTRTANARGWLGLRLREPYL